jgi:hypothetical protein
MPSDLIRGMPRIRSGESWSIKKPSGAIVNELGTMAF